MRMITLTCMFALFIGCQNIEQLDTLEEGVGDFTKDVSQIPKIIVRDALDIEEEEDVDNTIQESDNQEEKIKKLEKRVKDLEKEKDDAADDLEDIFEKIDCMKAESSFKQATKKCLN